MLIGKVRARQVGLRYRIRLRVHNDFAGAQPLGDAQTQVEQHNRTRTRARCRRVEP